MTIFAIRIYRNFLSITLLGIDFDFYWPESKKDWYKFNIFGWHMRIFNEYKYFCGLDKEIKGKSEKTLDT